MAKYAVTTMTKKTVAYTGYGYYAYTRLKSREK